MSSKVFCDWLERFLLPNVPANAVIVIDRATYHLTLTDDTNVPLSNAKKEVLVEWLLGKNVVDDNGELYTADRFANEVTIDNRKKWKKEMLWCMIDKVKPVPKLKITEIIEKFNEQHMKTINYLILPIAHPILNPIEVMWAGVKKYVRDNNFNENMERIKNLALEKIEIQNGPDNTAAHWNASFNHTMNFIHAQLDAGDVEMDEITTADVEEDDIHDNADEIDDDENDNNAEFYAMEDENNHSEQLMSSLNDVYDKEYVDFDDNSNNNANKYTNNEIVDDDTYYSRILSWFDKIAAGND